MRSVARACRTESQKKIVKLFESLEGKYSINGLWSDFIVMTACAISNAVDAEHREQREEMFQSISSKYGSKEMTTFSQILGSIVQALEENPSQDLLGEIYMCLGLRNESTGQFFTPYSLCMAMAEMSSGDLEQRLQEKEWITVYDPACGAGATLIAFANVCLKKKINYQQRCLFSCQELDFTTACMCYIQLSLLGCPGYIYVGDTLCDPCTGYDGRALLPKPSDNLWYMMMYFMEPWGSRRELEGIRLLIERMSGGKNYQNQELPKSRK